MNTKHIIKLFILALLFTGFGAFKLYQTPGNWVAPTEASKKINPFKYNLNATKLGKKKYLQLCNICHGDSGKGDGVAGLALDPRPASFVSDKIQSQTDGALFWKMSTGNAPMAAYKDILKEEERWQLVNYIRTFKK